MEGETGGLLDGGDGGDGGGGSDGADTGFLRRALRLGGIGVVDEGRLCVMMRLLGMQGYAAM